MHWIGYIFAFYAVLVIFSLLLSAIEFAKNPTKHMVEGKKRYKDMF